MVIRVIKNYYEGPIVVNGEDDATIPTATDSVKTTAIHIEKSIDSDDISVVLPIHESKRNDSPLTTAPTTKPQSQRRVHFADVLVSHVWERPRTEAEDIVTLFYSREQVMEFRTNYYKQILIDQEEEEETKVVANPDDLSCVRDTIKQAVAGTVAMFGQCRSWKSFLRYSISEMTVVILEAAYSL